MSFYPKKYNKNGFELLIVNLILHAHYNTNHSWMVYEFFALFKYLICVNYLANTMHLSILHCLNI